MIRSDDEPVETILSTDTYHGWRLKNCVSPQFAIKNDILAEPAISWVDIYPKPIHHVRGRAISWIKSINTFSTSWHSVCKLFWKRDVISNTGAFMGKLFRMTATTALSFPLLVACGHTSSHSPQSSQPSAQELTHYDVLVEEPQKLNLPSAETSGSNSFSVELSASSQDIQGRIPFHYTTDGRTKMTVKLPILSGENCSRPPEVTNLDFTSGTGKLPLFLWSPGWVRAPGATVGVGYGIEEDVKPNEKETIVVLLTIPSGCTKLTGTFDVDLH